MNFFHKILTIAPLLLCNLNCYSDQTTFNNNLTEETQFNQRWQEVEKNNIQLPLWTPTWTKAELKNRFKQMQKDRWQVYFTNPTDFDKKEVFGNWKDIFQMPKNYKIWGSRYPYPLAFLYNLATPNYNASVITLNQINFIALEAPTSKNIQVFFQVLNTYNVTDLVRLTPQIYQGREGSFPYWKNNIMAKQKINYVATDNWKDHHGLTPKKLIALINAVKNAPYLEHKMIAVHCRAGIGRTGTFIAAYALIKEIDQQIAAGVQVAELKINIDEIIWKLSLQRPFAVTHFPQYLSLYELVNYYTKKLPNA